MRAVRAAIGLDLGGTAIKYGICTSSGEILLSLSRPSLAAQSAKAVLDQLAAAALEALEVATARGLTVGSVGLGTPGNVDVERGFLMGGTPNFRHWRDVPVKEELEKRLPLNVEVDNDANLMALAELRFGAARGCRDVVCITLGTGIGGGIILDGELFRGHGYCGGEVGHASIRYDGKKCRCGGRGCWELYASATAMIRFYRQKSRDRSVNNSAEIFARFKQGEKVAIETVNRSIRMAAAGLSGLLNIFNPERVVIGGGMSEAGPWFVDAIAEQVKKRAMEGAVRNVRIVPAELGNKAGLLGAAAFALLRHDDQDNGAGISQGQ